MTAIIIFKSYNDAQLSLESYSFLQVFEHLKFYRISKTKDYQFHQSLLNFTLRDNLCRSLNNKVERDRRVHDRHSGTNQFDKDIYLKKR